MSIIEIIAVAFALAMDAFAVSVGIALSQGGIRRLQTFRLAFHFGLFQFLMPIAGWFVGIAVLNIVQSIDHWIAFGLLLFIGIKMIRGSFKDQKKDKRSGFDPTKGLSLLFLSVATSIDAFAVGLSLGALQISILHPALVIGLVAFLMSMVGAWVGPALGLIFGKKAELFGGLILIVIGAKILIDHIT
jgi:putative Mn2+ efflux pump MntP